MVAADLAVERADQRAGRPAGGRSGRTSRRHSPGRGNASRSRPSSGYDGAGCRAAAHAPRAQQSPGAIETCSRARWRSRRFTRLRTTAFPTALLTTKPTARPGGARRPDRSSRWTTRVARAGPPAPARPRTGRPPTRVSRWAAGSTGPGGRGTGPAQTARLLRPLRRREDRIGAAGAGAHAQAEPVHLVTAAVVRLVRTLAHELSLRWVSGQSRRCDRRCPDDSAP